MYEIVFLEAPGRILSKIYSESGVKSYPMVKKFTSHKHVLGINHQTLELKTKLLHEAADNGHCLLKGPLTRNLVNESRAGATNRDAVTYSLILDFDNITLPDVELIIPVTGLQLEQLAKTVIKHLPSYFDNTSFIVHASNSLGLKPNVFSLHIEFLLDKPVAPRILKQALIALNFESEFKDQISINPSGMSLNWPIDIALADNSRLIYIAPPNCIKPIIDPFERPEDRILFIKLENNALNTDRLIEKANVEALQNQCNKTLRNLRKLAGLGQRKMRTQLIRYNKKPITIITNPDKMILHLVAEEGPYLRFNINDGDSAAYYVDKRNPSIVQNFKGELPFSLEHADPDTYEKILETYSSELGTDEHGRKPFAFRDIITNTYYNGFCDVQDKSIFELYKTTKNELEDFFTDHTFAKPDIIRQIYYVFDPTTPTQMDIGKRFVNQYQQPKLFETLPKLDDQYVGKEIGESIILKDLCPTIYKVIHSIVGSDDEEFEYFINWLSFIVQKRDKTLTSYILHGTQGTGKGVFFSDIMTPILGEKYCSQKKIKDLDDLSNNWVENKLFVMIDEFDIQEARNVGRTENILKNLITEKRSSMRAMREDQRDIRSYTNFFIASNSDGAMRIAEGDRRFNVCPPQMVKLAIRHPIFANWYENKKRYLDPEIPVFAAYLCSFSIDLEAVSTVRKTEARAQMQQNTMLTTDIFCQALLDGNLDYFIDIVNDAATTVKDMELKGTYDLIVKKQLPLLGKTGHISLSDIRVLYMRIFSKEINIKAIGKLLARHKVPIYRKTLEGVKQRVMPITWELVDYTVKELTETLYTETERNALGIKLAS